MQAYSIEGHVSRISKIIHVMTTSGSLFKTIESCFLIVKVKILWGGMKMRQITLNSNVNMPIVGSGTNTYGKEGNQFAGALRGDTQEIDWAIENGYRHFDSAQLYVNVEVVGKGIKKSSLPREDFIINTKLNTREGYKSAECVHAAVDRSLKTLVADYVDIF